MRSAYRQPPRIHGPDGQVRKIGVEIEFAGLDVEETSRLVERLYGGRIEPINRVGVTVKETRLGDFRVEIDSFLLKNEKYRSVLDKLGVESEGQEKVEDALVALATKWIPSEIACPPIPLSELAQLDPLRDALFEAGALGTRASLIYAFGFQLNPEVPGDDPETLKNHLAAFLLLYDFIVEESKIDIARKIAPFIDPFPDEYRRLLLQHDYHPNTDELIDDYLEHNPTRNRPLDMLPMFATLREEKVKAAVKEPDQVKKRPTFHYRLPNCLIDEKDWSFATEWNRWVEVERLAADPVRLRAMSDALLQLDARPFGVSRKRWLEESLMWL